MKYLLLLIAVFLVACEDARGNQSGDDCPGSVGVGAQLAAIGGWFTLIGGFGLGFSALGVVASLLFSTVLGGFRKLFGEIAVCCFVSVLIGASLTWLGNNPWLLAVCIGLTAILIGLRYRVGLAVLWDYIINPTPKGRKKTSQPLS